MKKYTVELTELEIVEFENIRHMMQKNVVEHFTKLSEIKGVHPDAIVILQNVAKSADKQCDFLKDIFIRGTRSGE